VDKSVENGRAVRGRATIGTPGAIAQLGERLAGSQKVAGSSPAGSIYNYEQMLHALADDPDAIKVYVQVGR
jgi:hypothetical protein